MTDRELLELAARAAGKRLWVDTNGLYWGNSEQWNPLTDDGDALRLAVKLNLHIQIDFDDPDCNCVFVYGNYCAEEPISECDDPYAATRRAIVRAAAAIGEEKK